jgi:hypothetical protein
LSASSGASCCSSTPFSAENAIDRRSAGVDCRADPLHRGNHGSKRLLVDDDPPALALAIDV